MWALPTVPDVRLRVSHAAIGSVVFVRPGPQSLKGGAAGTLYLDQFESRRLSMIGN
jgi:hypothetical protein